MTSLLAHILLVEQEISEVILHSFERLHVGKYRSNHSIITHIFKKLESKEASLG